MRRAAILLIVGLLLVVNFKASAANIEIIDLGVISGTYSESHGVSSDGTVVVGSSGNRAFRWTSSGGMQNLGVISGQANSWAGAVSSDGSVVVGNSGNRAFRWTSSGGMQNLGVVSGGSSSGARGVSADGSVVVGWAASVGSTSTPFRWTATSGMQSIGFLGGSAEDVSADGTVVVGYSGDQAFRWTANGGMKQLIDGRGGPNLGSLNSQASGVSSDGSVIVGYGNYGDRRRAFRWTVTEGTRDLGVLSGGSTSWAGAVTSDGNFVVGTSDSSNEYLAVIWDIEKKQIRDLGGILKERGVLSINDWTNLYSARAISGNSTSGFNIVGEGKINGSDHAFLIRGLTLNVPEPSVFVMSSIATGAMAYIVCRRKSQ